MTSLDRCHSSDLAASGIYVNIIYNIDGLSDYQLETIPGATTVVNPVYRELDSQIRSTHGKLSHRLAKFGSMNLESEIEPEKVEGFERKKSRIARRDYGLSGGY